MQLKQLEKTRDEAGPADWVGGGATPTNFNSKKKNTWRTDQQGPCCMLPAKKRMNAGDMKLGSIKLRLVAAPLPPPTSPTHAASSPS